MSENRIPRAIENVRSATALLVTAHKRPPIDQLQSLAAAIADLAAAENLIMQEAKEIQAAIHELLKCFPPPGPRHEEA